LLLDLQAAAGHLPGPLHGRLTDALREAIREGRLRAGSLLPSSRVLAAELGCSRWVVTQAYAQLAAEGYLDGQIGSGTRVRMTGAETPASGAVPAPSGPARTAIDLAPGLPDLRAFPVTRWVTAVRAAAAAMPVADLGYPDPAGHPVLRDVLSGYLTRVRGARANPAHLTVCGSVRAGIARLCGALREVGCQAIAVENPGWHRLREQIASSGLTVVPVPVDDQGLRADLLDQHPEAGAVVVSPAHQFPVGTVLSAPRRAALLAWARRTGGLIIEDDYDAEYRYDRRPVGALQGADPGAVALLGSVSKTLSPALGIGWMVTPPRWTALLRSAHMAAPPVLDQLAFAEFTRAGSYDRHLRAGRQRYRQRRDALVRALAAELPQARVAGASAGLHLVALLDGLDAGAIQRRALALGVRVANLDTYRAGTGFGGEPGLVLGYGNLADHQLGAAVSLLAQAVITSSGASPGTAFV
jgi:GntR family transcriptional regulator/MocR family aminotransferase